MQVEKVLGAAIKMLGLQEVALILLQQQIIHCHLAKEKEFRVHLDLCGMVLMQ